MTTQSCTSRDMGRVAAASFYTGTEDQPDNVSIFYKNGNQIKIRDEAINNSMGHSPSKMFSGKLRLEEASKRMKELPVGDRERSNAFKNSFRAVVQLPPFLGNAILIVYDYLKTHLCFHRKLKAALASENGPIMGIAFDGKVVATFSPEQINPGGSRDTDGTLAVLAYTWFAVIGAEVEARGTRTRLELAQQAISPLFAPNRVSGTVARSGLSRAALDQIFETVSRELSQTVARNRA